MAEQKLPWYVQWVIGIGAWVTALIVVALGAAIVFSGLDLDDESALAVIGAIFLVFGMWMLRQPDRGVFTHQLGIATAAAGTALIAGGLAAETDSLWFGMAISLILWWMVTAMTDSRILQFLVAAMTASFLVFALLEERTSYLLDFAALATPVAIYLFLRPPQRNLMPTAVALLFVFPLLSTFVGESTWLFRNVEQGGTVARILHIVLFLGLTGLHWQKADGRAKTQVVAFAVVATIVCLLLPPGGSAAMLVLMLAYVIGSRPLALAGAALQTQFIIRYYHNLDMTLLDKSLLLMGVGVLLLGAWWMLYRQQRAAA